MQTNNIIRFLLKDQKKLGKEKSPADEKLPKFSRNCLRIFNGNFS